jgi:hypothetical protein
MTVAFYSKANTITSCIITDDKGATIKEFLLNTLLGKNTFKVSLVGLPKGSDILTLSIDNQVVSERFVKL